MLPLPSLSAVMPFFFVAVNYLQSWFLFLQTWKSQEFVWPGYLVLCINGYYNAWFNPRERFDINLSSGGILFPAVFWAGAASNFHRPDEEYGSERRFRWSHILSKTLFHYFFGLFKFVLPLQITFFVNFFLFPFNDAEFLTAFLSILLFYVLSIFPWILL